jgi:hypothetical protein
MIHRHSMIGFARKWAALLAGLAVALLALSARPAQGAGLYAEVFWEIFWQASASSQQTRTPAQETVHVRSCPTGSVDSGTVRSTTGTCGFVRTSKDRCVRTKAQVAENEALMRDQLQESGSTTVASSGPAEDPNVKCCIGTSYDQSLIFVSSEDFSRCRRETEDLKRTVAQQNSQITGLLQQMEGMQRELQALRQQVQALQMQPHPMPYPGPYPYPNPNPYPQPYPYPNPYLQPNQINPHIPFGSSWSTPAATQAQPSTAQPIQPASAQTSRSCPPVNASNVSGWTVPQFKGY